MLWTLFVLAFLVTLNGFFAMSELAVVSARRATLKEWEEQGSRRARIALKLSEHSTRFLSTIQIGITLVGLLAGAEAGAHMAESVAQVLRQYALLAPYASSLSLILVVLPLTYFSLVWGELFPKRLALAHPERIACWIAPLVHRLSQLAAPLIWVLTQSTHLLAWIFRVRSEQRASVSEDEIRAMAAMGVDEGIIEQIEHEIVSQVFYLGDRQVSSLQTPRMNVVWLDIQDTPQKLYHKICRNMHSVYPVCEGRFDRVLGMVHIKDLLNTLLSQHELDLKSIMRPALIVPEQLHAYKLLAQFQQSKRHYGLVTDEYGTLTGIVTLNDLLEALVGDLEDNPALDAQCVSDEAGGWLIDGHYPFETLAEELKWQLPEAVFQLGFQTLAGFCLYQLEHVPKEGERFEWQGLKFEILKMDAHRIDRLRLTGEFVPEEETEEDAPDEPIA